ncbi:FAD-dependent oxidoreductase [Halorubellus sp. PRR65]|uniref:NAD(P)/FAD-dependent oxidoreductase n=1 Tax=Halorubellus sp. PRR65 TaxID=3098148 RepID=UPI002B25BE3D|nr:FAD-dependent oxidoreductase [Halorubellus sp. PRR65]
MATNVTVLGAGYAGAGAVKELQKRAGSNVSITWVADVDYHLVLHESHRIIREPSVAEKIKIPVREIADHSTEFVRGEVVGLDEEAREVELDDGDTIEYDYCLVALGSQTAFFGIDGLEEHSLTLKSADDALAIHDAVSDAAADATRSDPADVIVGGAGLSGIQSAAEIAKFRDEKRAPIDVHLVEGLDSVFPGNDPEVQGALRKRLEALDINILTGEFIGEVDEETVYIGEDAEMDYDVLLWTGGITGRDALGETEVDKEHNRFQTGQDFQTTDDRVFAIGDSAIIEQPGEDPAPPTAQAAWQAADVAAENVVRTIEGRRLTSWVHEDKGTVISVGDKAVAHDVQAFGVSAPVTTFGGFPAKNLKKAIAARWIADVAGYGRAVSAWSML